MAANGKTTYRVLKRLTDEERDRVLKEFVRLQAIEQSPTQTETLSIPDRLSGLL